MGRTVEFAPDGKRARVSPQEVADGWRLRSAIIPAQYAVATADHESSFTLNEIDTEPSGFKSYGIFQLSDEEASKASRSTQDLLTLEGACDVLVAIAENRLSQILRAAGLVAPTPDCWFYLALGHNEGMGACLKTIAAHGLNANAWVARNPQLAQASRYFLDAISGGSRWNEVSLH